jgi:tetratricopeptide (TPR) repeat protein
MLLGGALYNLGEAERSLGRVTEAGRLFEEARGLARRLDRSDREAYCAIGLGLVAFDRDLPAEASEEFLVAREAAGRAGDPFLEAYSGFLLGVARYRQQRFGEALEILRSARQAAEEIEDRWLVLQILVNLAQATLDADDPEEAERLFLEALDLEGEIGSPDRRWEIHNGLSGVALALGQYPRAVEEAETAVNVIESMRGQLDLHLERTQFLHGRFDVYATLAAALVRVDPGNIDEAFLAMEAAHARALREALDTDDSRDRDLSYIGLKDVRTLLGPDDVLVEYLLGYRRSLALAVRRDGAVLHELPPRHTLTERIGRYRQVLQRPVTALDARLDPAGDFLRFGDVGHRLFEDLLGPIQESVLDAERLFIVPDRHLHLIPFEALTVQPLSEGKPVEFLGQRTAICYLPAAAFLAKERTGTPASVLVVSAPDGGRSQDLPTLRFADAEEAAIRDVYPPDRFAVLKAEDADPAALASGATGRFDCLHLIAHACVDPLSGPRIYLERILGVDEIAGLRSPPPLVVLSACDSGRGELVEGEGVLGLVRAFTLAGSEQVVASLWSVDDEHSALLMGRFHEGLRAGLPASAALLEARRSLLDESPHPYSWSPFVLYGAAGRAR